MIFRHIFCAEAHAIFPPDYPTIETGGKMTEQFLRYGFKYLNRYMLLMWRLGLARWLNAAPQTLGQYMVIQHTGRKSGKVYRTPVNYAVVDREIYCVAGFGSISDWYRNLMAQPQAELWLQEGCWQVFAEDETDCEDALTKIRAVLINSGFAARLAGLNPHTMSDNELAALTADYRLIRLKQIAPITENPADLTWVWGLILVNLVVVLLLRRKAAR
jgi:deazaflavin-dependent oxidoreductase (nitroreductase family)